MSMIVPIAQSEHNTIQTAGFGGDLFYRFVSFIDAKPATVATYKRAIKQMFKYFAEQGITTDPTRENIIAYREHLKETLKPSTVQMYIIAAKMFFRWAEGEGICKNVADNIKGAKLNREHKKDYLTSGQIGDILQGIDRSTRQGKRDYAILFLMVTGGLRTIEVSRANIEDLRSVGDSTVLYIQGKGKRRENGIYEACPRCRKSYPRIPKRG